MYVCWDCGTEIETLEGDSVRCPKCGCRVLTIKRQPVAREVKAD